MKKIILVIGLLCALPAQAELTKSEREIAQLFVGYNFASVSAEKRVSLLAQLEERKLVLDGVHKGILEGLSALKFLEELTISNMGLTEIPASVLKLSKGLKKLNLAHNDIAVLPDDITGFEQLEDLNVAHNPLTALAPSVLKITTLRSLTINVDSLTSADDDMLTMESLKEHFGGVKCDGNLLTFKNGQDLLNEELSSKDDDDNKGIDYALYTMFYTGDIPPYMHTGGGFLSANN